MDDILVFVVALLGGALFSSSRFLLFIVLCCGCFMAAIGGLVALLGWIVQPEKDPFESALGFVRAMLFGGSAIALGAGIRLAYEWIIASANQPRDCDK